MTKIIGALFLFLVFPALAFSADKVYLKNGRVLKGEIVKETDYSVKIKVNNIPMTYYISEIEKIEREDAEAKKERLGKKKGKVSDAERELILRLFDINGTRDGIRRIFLQVIHESPPDVRPRLEKILDTEEVLKRLVPVYHQYYSEAELRELVKFYTSPTGRLHIENAPKIMRDTMKVTSEYFTERVQAAAKQEDEMLKKEAEGQRSK